LNLQTGQSTRSTSANIVYICKLNLHICYGTDAGLAHVWKSEF